MNVTDYEYKKGLSVSNIHLFNRVDKSGEDWVVIIDSGNTHDNHRYSGVLASKNKDQIRTLTQEEVAQFRMLAFPYII
jgi:hypothetical protein